jgi:multiple sugar transport system permease protein
MARAVTDVRFSLEQARLEDARAGVIGYPAAPYRRLSEETFWGIVLLLPYLAVFLLFVLYPVAYGFYLGTRPENFPKLFADPIFSTAVVNTVIFLLVGVNLKMLLALFLSGFFLHPARWIRWLSVIFILAWAVPSIPTILSFRWMLNPEWGLINALIFKWFQIDGPGWLTEPRYALGAAILVHIWKWLPFWTLIFLAGRMSISTDLYESAAVDGASAWQMFRYVTFPHIRGLYLTSLLLSTIWTLGDFNSIYLLTGGGPADLTQVLATLGVRYLRMDALEMGLAAIVIAMPAVIPIVWYMVKHLGGEQQA